MRNPERWPKKLAYLLVGAFRGEENFAGAQKTFELFAQGIDTVLCGGLIRPESYLLQFDLAKPKTIKVIETAFEQAGIELATTGEITAETAARAATPLSSDLHHFQVYANIYWEHARSLGPRALDVSAVRDLVLGDMRVLLSEMVRSVDAVATARKRFVLQFDFTDTGAHFRVSVDHGTATLAQETSENVRPARDDQGRQLGQGVHAADQHARRAGERRDQARGGQDALHAAGPVLPAPGGLSDRMS